MQNTIIYWDVKTVPMALVNHDMTAFYMISIVKFNWTRVLQSGAKNCAEITKWEQKLQMTQNSNIKIK